MVEAVIRFLIGVCLVALCIFLVIWVFGAVGIHLPQTVIHILYVIAALVCILYLVTLLRPHWGNWLP